MNEKKLIIPFLGGLTTTIISFFNKPVLCVKPMVEQRFWYDWGFPIGIMIMLISIIVFLLVNQDNWAEKEAKKNE